MQRIRVLRKWSGLGQNLWSHSILLILTKHPSTHTLLSFLPPVLYVSPLYLRELLISYICPLLGIWQFSCLYGQKMKGVHDNIHQTNCICKEDQRLLLRAHTDYKSRFTGSPTGIRSSAVSVASKLAVCSKLGKGNPHIGRTELIKKKNWILIVPLLHFF